MKIQVLGMDPSLKNWGLAEATLDLETGVLSTPVLSVICPRDDDKKKVVRKNSLDLDRAKELAIGIEPACRKANVIFVEVPHGSQSARAMASYGICIGVLGSLMARAMPIVEVSASENKKHFTGSKTATKEMMISKAIELYPEAKFPMKKSSGVLTVVESKAEHMADAIAAIHAGVQTPMFQNLMTIFKMTNKE